MNYTISDIYKDQDMKFTLQGTYEEGLDKSIANGLRRIISSEIPSVAFRTDEGTKLDIKIDINNSSLHNEP